MEHVLHALPGFRKEIFDDRLHAFGERTDARITAEAIDRPAVDGDLGIEHACYIPVPHRTGSPASQRGGDRTAPG